RSLHKPRPWPPPSPRPSLDSTAPSPHNHAPKTPPSSSGLGYLVLSQRTGVRLPLGVWVLLGAKRHRQESSRTLRKMPRLRLDSFSQVPRRSPSFPSLLHRILHRALRPSRTALHGRYGNAWPQLRAYCPTTCRPSQGRVRQSSLSRN